MIRFGGTNGSRRIDVTINGASYELDCAQHHANVKLNIYINLTIAASTITVINAKKTGVINIYQKVGLAGASLTFGSGFKMSSNNDTPLTGINNTNAYQFLVDDTANEAKQMGMLATIV